jgi:hypothetical protein
MKPLLIGFAVVEIACTLLMLLMCVFKHVHREKYGDRVKLVIVLCACIGVFLGLVLDTELSLPGAGLFELIFIYIIHTLYLQDFEPKRKYPDETP